MPKKILPEEYKEYFQQNYTNYELLSDYKGDKVMETFGIQNQIG